MNAATGLAQSPTLSERNLVEMLVARAATKRTPAAEFKTPAGWKTASWTEVLAQVRAVSNGLVAWGIRPGDRVAVFAQTSLTWCVVDLAISAARAICVPIYASNTPDEVRYVLQNSGSRMLFVDHDQQDAKQAGRLTRVRERLALTECRQLVLFEGGAASGAELSLQALIDLGRAEDGFDARVKGIQPDDLCHFIYTSGTTGDPKGVMLSHGNWAYEAAATREAGVVLPGDAVLLFLPLAHSFAQVAKAAWLSTGLQMTFAESVEKVVANLAETKPTVLPSVPRIFEKVFAGVQANATGAPGVKGRLARWAFRLFDEYCEAQERGQRYDSLAWTLARRLVFTKVRDTLDQRLGGRMRVFVSGGAPLSRKIGYFFDLLGLQVCEGYGLTETSAASTVGRPGKLRIGTVGTALPGVELKIAADGEVLIRGPHIMKGYWQNPTATAEALDPDGWFHSGDIGELDREGFLRITDRKKDLIKTSGGKYCAPQNLENALKTHAIISNSMVYGDTRPYLTVLICVSEEAARKLLGEPGATLTYEALAQRPEVREAVKQALDAVNATQPPYGTMKRFAIMDHDFTQETGELTPTLKVKRKFCTQRFMPLLDALYASGKAAD
jgi:long-chain acyl-CoA synthetase